MLSPFCRFCFILLAGSAVASFAHADPLVYNQPASPGAYNTWPSFSSGGGDGITTYDNFALTSSARVTAVQWHGNYVNAGTPSANPAPPDTDSFEITFRADQGGGPGAVLLTAIVPMSRCEATALFPLDFHFTTGGPAYRVSFYSYRAVLPSAFLAGAGRKYWIGIRGNCSAADPGWSWYSGVPGNRACLQDTGVYKVCTLDRNFALEGTSDAPAVSVAAVDPVAHLRPNAPGTFTLTLSAPRPSPVTVRYKLSGSAVNGRDYARLPAKARFNAGETRVILRVTPQGDLDGAKSRKVKLTLLETGAYTSGAFDEAKVKIVSP